MTQDNQTSSSIVPAAGDGFQNPAGEWRVKLSGDDTGGAFTLLEHVSPPGAQVPTHLHDEEDETIYVLEGEADLILSGACRRIVAGETVFMPRRTVHGYTIAGGQPCRMLHFITPAGLEHFFREVGRLAPERRAEWSAITELASEYGLRFVP